MADRTDPGAIPTFANAGEGVGAGRRMGVAQNHVLGGVNYGTIAHAGVRAASGPRMTGQATRSEPAILSRLPVSVVRPVWERISLLGSHNSEVPPPATAPDPAGSAVHGPECLDCARR